MATKYYTNLFEIEDEFRRKKYQSLLLASLQNDINKWTESPRDDKTIYQSPTYNGSCFGIEIRHFGSTTFAFVTHSNAIIPNRVSELISNDFSKDLKIAFEKLRNNVYSPEIYEIEKIIGNKHSRKEKLDALELAQIKESIEDTYQDWIKNENEILAKMIAKIMYSYRRDEEIYNLWVEKFGDIKLINKELNRIKG